MTKDGQKQDKKGTKAGQKWVKRGTKDVGVGME